MSKLVQILKEEGEKKLINVSEKAIMEAFELLEAVAPRLALEGEGAEKVVGGILATAIPVFKPAIEKLADLNKDGKIG